MIFPFTALTKDIELIYLIYKVHEGPRLSLNSIVN